VPTKLLLLAVLAATFVTAHRVAAQTRPDVPLQTHPDCAIIVRTLNKLHGSSRFDSGDVASKLNTDSDWVEECASMYGRRIKPAPRKPSEDDDNLTPAREEQEYEETAREEAGQEANKVQEDLRNGVYATKDRGIDPDSSAEWEPYITHEWEPFITHEWQPFIRDDDDPGFD